MIQFNPSTYSSEANEASDLGNLRFYQGSQALYSWCESGCSSAASEATFWIKLPSGVGASSSTTVNMIFTSNTEYDLSSSGTSAIAGEAPQLSSSYGEYDNGENIFIYYQNFTSSSEAAGWGSGGGGSISYTINKGLTVASSSGCSGCDPEIYYNSQVSNYQTVVLDAYINAESQSAEYLGYTYGVDGSSQDDNINANCPPPGSCSSPNYVFALHTSNGGTGEESNMNNSPNINSNFHVISYYAPGASAGWIDYTDYSTFTGDFQISIEYPVLLAGGNSNQVVQWFRERVLPPGSPPTMPSATPSIV